MYSEYTVRLTAGCVVSKSATLLEQVGNDHPRYKETDLGAGCPGSPFPLHHANLARTALAGTAVHHCLYFGSSRCADAASV
jgi:hypothetical protein